MIQSFEPIIDAQCRLLILGSMPGVQSLNAHQYYAHPRNQFWRIIYTLVGEQYDDNYQTRKQFLLTHHIALWDVIKVCEREGSLDAAIQNEVANDFKGLFASYPNIQVVIFNGDKAYKTFKKYVGFSFTGIRFHKVASSSPAHAVSFEKRLEEWAILKQQLTYLGND